MSLIHIRAKDIDFEISCSENRIHLSGLKGEIVLEVSGIVGKKKNYDIKFSPTQKDGLKKNKKYLLSSGKNIAWYSTQLQMNSSVLCCHYCIQGVSEIRVLILTSGRTGQIMELLDQEML
jgi:hypothetical protein